MDLSYDSFQKSKISQANTQVNTPPVDLSYGAYQKRATEVPPPSLFDQGVKAVVDYSRQNVAIEKPFQQTVVNAFLHPIDTAKKIFNQFATPFSAGVDEAHKSVDAMVADYEKGTGSTAGDIKNLLNTALGVGGAIFSPISAVTNIASKIPGVKPLADVVNYGFGKIGEAGGYTFEKALDLTPDTILSQETKDILKQPVKDVGSFAAQIVIGGKIMGKIGDMVSKGEVVTPEKATEVVKSAKEELATKAPEVAPTKPLSYEAFQADQAVVPDQQGALRDIYAKTGASDIPGMTMADKVFSEVATEMDLAKAGERIFVPSEIGGGTDVRAVASTFPDWVPEELRVKKLFDKVVATLDPSKVEYPPASQPRLRALYDAVLSEVDSRLGIDTSQIRNNIISKYENNKQIPTPEVIPGSTEGGKGPGVTDQKVVLPERAPGVTKAASDINQNLVKQGFDALPVEEQSKYTPQSYKEIADKIASKMTSNIEEVKAIAKGEKPLPNDLNGQILFNAVEAHAMKVGDVQLLKDLAKSPLGTKLSEAGQTLGGHGFNDNPNSAVKAIKEVSDIRQKAVERKTGKTVDKAKKAVVDEIKKEIKKKTPTKQTWAEFVDSIKC